ncbi:MAG TPA: MarR family transcriptional regulator [Acidimicrobiales bacterium]|nr:MarR family transcriptional regulator [Acidimicrobiales bacterium]
MAGVPRGPSTTTPLDATGDEAVVEAIVRASRAIMGIAVQSLSEVSDEVTLAQYRTLVVLALEGPRRLADLAEALEVSPSTTTRMCDRLEAKALIERTRDELDRREVNLGLTDAGQKLVDTVMDRRREGVRLLLQLVPGHSRPALVESLTVLTQAAAEMPQFHWAPGWSP